MASLISTIGMVIGAIGIFAGFYFLPTDPALALRLVTGLSVGAVGLLAFVRHVIFHRSDAIRLGWPVDHPEWQLEVGFANLALGLPALFIATVSPSYPAFFVLLAAYGLYLAQAAILHGIGYIKKRPQPLNARHDKKKVKPLYTATVKNLPLLTVCGSGYVRPIVVARPWSRYPVRL